MTSDSDSDKKGNDIPWWAWMIIVVVAVALISIGVWWLVKRRKGGPKSVTEIESGSPPVTEPAVISVPTNPTNVDVDECRVTKEQCASHSHCALTSGVSPACVPRKWVVEKKSMTADNDLMNRGVSDTDWRSSLEAIKYDKADLDHLPPTERAVMQEQLRALIR